MVIPNEEGTGYIREVISVEYEWKPSHYVACIRFGHGPTTCLNRVIKDVQKAPSMAANKPNLMADQEEVFVEVKGRRKKGKAGKDMGDASNLGAKDQKDGTSKQSSIWTDDLESDDEVDEILVPE
nr:hypothetical protein [Tanacetum cinerariifolium]